MEIVQIVIIGLCAVIFIAVLDKHKEFGVYLRIVTGVIMFFIFIDKFDSIIILFNKLNALMNIDDMYMKILFQILGIAFVTEFGSQLCKDSGEKSIASNIEIAGRIIILVLSAPIVLGIINLIESIM
ncbi:MAG: stage III sporulation protein AD [Firmicutes bacterium HGW-Firmicutes-7]|nr:MAG: stage III sporulation protein AD [Firmicutes bacterium HGW-Firmicutes-7]